MSKKQDQASKDSYEDDAVVDTSSQDAQANDQPERMADEAVDDSSSQPDSSPVRSADDPTPQPVVSDHQSRVQRLKHWVAAHKKIAIPGLLVVVLAILAAVPFTRYALAGLVLKQTFAVRVVDAETKKPVSSAVVELAGKQAKTDSKGHASMQAPVGSATLKVTKTYYKGTSLSVTVPILRQKDVPQVSLKATGRQVSFTVLNAISKKPVANASVTAGESESKTDKSGVALLVVPAGKKEVIIQLSAKGYNGLTKTIPVGVQTLKPESFSLTPAGKVYFISNKSGKLDVVKSNLDGTERQVVLEGTGKEVRGETSLLASRDWRYLALHAKRDSDKAKLYLIDTNTDKLTTMDEGNASFRLSGWIDHRFVYTVDREKNDWEPKRQAVKSYDAVSGKLTTLDETAAEGTQFNYASEFFYTPYLLGKEVVYLKKWSASNSSMLAPKRHALISVSPDGKAKKTLKQYEPYADGKYVEVEARPYGVGELYILTSKGYDDPTSSIEEYDKGQLTAVKDVSRDDFYNEAYPTYLESPSGQRTFWSDFIDGKTTIFLGNANGEDKKQVLALPETYGIYGWYTDDYILFSKNGSELYLASSTEIAGEKSLFKATDYYRVGPSYRGYGGGYGGL